MNVVETNPAMSVTTFLFVFLASRITLILVIFVFLFYILKVLFFNYG